MIGQAFSLGLSAGLFCVGRCVPTLTPLLLLSPHKGLKNGLGLVGLFLSGRLVTYGALGVMAGFAGSFGSTFPAVTMLLALSQIALGAMLISQALYSCAQKRCPGKKILFGTKKTIFFAGLLSSATLCPPILLAISMAMESGTPGRGFVFFLIFFLATSFYMLPIAFASIKFNNKIILYSTRIICTGTGLYCIWSGLSLLFSKHYLVY